MIGNSLLTQVVIAAIAIGIVITYIQPKLSEIKVRQDEIAQTQAELQRVTEVNERLAALYTQLNQISQQDKASLLTYLPDTVDEVKVLRDLSYIARDAEVELKDVKYEGKGDRPSEAVETDPYAHQFMLTFESSYEGLKSVLSLLERNNYPLVVDRLNVKPTQGGFLDVEIGVVTYSRNDTEEN